MIFLGRSFIIFQKDATPRGWAGHPIIQSTHPRGANGPTHICDSFFGQTRLVCRTTPTLDNSRSRHVQRFVFATERFDHFLVLAIGELILFVQVIDNGKHFEAINVGAHGYSLHLRIFANLYTP